MLVLPLSGFDNATQFPSSRRRSLVSLLAGHTDRFVDPCSFQPYQNFLLPESNVAIVLLGMFCYNHNISSLILAQWRLLLAGVYPVEWRDFYLGDMFCSLTYSMGVSAPSTSHLHTLILYRI